MPRGRKARREVTTRRWLAAALAAGMWGIACAAAASPEYRKDPEVRAAIEQKLKTSDEAEIRKRLRDDGSEVVTSSPGELAKDIQEETAQWTQVIRNAGIKPE